MHLCDKGLILRAVPWREADQMLTILTECGGKLSAVARGVRRKSSRISAAVQSLAYSEFTLYEGGGRYTVNEAEPIELFFELRQDIVKLALASYFAELLDVAADAEVVNPELLRLGLNALYALCKLPTALPAVKAAFELKIAAFAGYEPRMGPCPVCGRAPVRPLLHLDDGAVHCAEMPAARRLDAAGSWSSAGAGLRAWKRRQAGVLLFSGGGLPGASRTGQRGLSCPAF